MRSFSGTVSPGVLSATVPFEGVHGSLYFISVQVTDAALPGQATVVAHDDGFTLCSMPPSTLRTSFYAAHDVDIPSRRPVSSLRSADRVVLHTGDVFTSPCGLAFGELVLRWQASPLSSSPRAAVTSGRIFGPPPQWYVFDDVGFAHGDVLAVEMTWTDGAGVSATVTLKDIAIDLRPPSGRCDIVPARVVPA